MSHSALESQITGSSLVHPNQYLPEVDPPVTPGMPFKKMYHLRQQISQLKANLSQLQSLLIRLQEDGDYRTISRLQSDIRFRDAELISLQKKLVPLEANFWKEQEAQRKSRPSEGQHKRHKIDRRDPSDDALGCAPTIKERLTNTASLEDAVSLKECTLAADDCQYDHLKRLRRQYAHPFELFCNEMDSIGNTCLTGICLDLPNMPWSIVVSRLGFLSNSTLDSLGTGHTLPGEY
ncbi:hypothetical protein F5Y19DRAFT_479983 [Xylariaceae sp. FL1651]|nr:hypothetical protein F5Y19DRAFT_479983 [Xylariaceae sp. FL1651]